MRRHLIICAALLTAAPSLFAAAAMFRGQLVYPSGRPARDVEVSARDYISLLNTPPWNWGPGWKIRGTTKTDRQGNFTLQSSASRPADLWFQAPGILEAISHPDPSRFHRVVVGQTKVTSVTTSYGKPPVRETRSLSTRKHP